MHPNICHYIQLLFKVDNIYSESSVSQIYFELARISKMEVRIFEVLL